MSLFITHAAMENTDLMVLQTIGNSMDLFSDEMIHNVLGGK